MAEHAKTTQKYVKYAHPAEQAERFAVQYLIVHICNLFVQVEAARRVALPVPFLPRHRFLTFNGKPKESCYDVVAHFPDQRSYGKG